MSLDVPRRTPLTRTDVLDRFEFRRRIEPGSGDLGRSREISRPQGSSVRHNAISGAFHWQPSRMLRRKHFRDPSQPSSIWLRGLGLALALCLTAMSCLQAAHIHGGRHQHRSAVRSASGPLQSDNEETCPLCQEFHPGLPARHLPAVVQPPRRGFAVSAAVIHAPSGQLAFDLFGRPPPPF